MLGARVVLQEAGAKWGLGSGGGDLCLPSPQTPSEADGRLEIFPLLYKIHIVVLKLVRLFTGEILSSHASICKVRHFNFLCLISVPSCTAKQSTRPTGVRREKHLQCLSLADLGHER